MPDVREHLQRLTQLDAPDLWGDARRRTPRPPESPSAADGPRKAVVIITALAIGVVASVFVFRAFERAEDPVPYGPPSGWASSEIAVLGITFRTPPGWQRQSFDEQGKVSQVGMLMSNTDLTFHHPTLPQGSTTTAWDMSELPMDGVAIAIERIDGAPPTGLPAPADTGFPLSLGDAEALTHEPDPTGFSPAPGPAAESLLSFVLDGRSSEVRVFIGPDASAEDRQAVGEVVASIMPTPCPDGVLIQVVGQRDLDRLGVTYATLPVDQWTVWLPERQVAEDMIFTVACQPEGDGRVRLIDGDGVIIPDTAANDPLGTIRDGAFVPLPREGAGGAFGIVPDLTGLSDRSALRSLDDLGLSWVVAYRGTEGVEHWHVAATDPVAGTSLPAGSTVRVLVSSEVTPLPAGAADVLACRAHDRTAFGGPRLVLTPGGSAYIAANIGGIARGDKVVQATFGGEPWDGLWHVIRGGAVIAVIDFATLDGEACLGSGVAGS